MYVCSRQNRYLLYKLKYYFVLSSDIDRDGTCIFSTWSPLDFVAFLLVFAVEAFSGNLKWTASLSLLF